ncbi:hypothetical protein FRC05_001819 [Tulasnella sp. 425]|nr:hypothetical protein FRC05_001819 [Tulasnella sp. 425]
MSNWTAEGRYLDGVKATGARVTLGLAALTFALVAIQLTIGDSWLAVPLAVPPSSPSRLAPLVYSHKSTAMTPGPSPTRPLHWSLTPYNEPWTTRRWFTAIARLAPIMIL